MAESSISANATLNSEVRASTMQYMMENGWGSRDLALNVTVNPGGQGSGAANFGRNAGQTNSFDINTHQSNAPNSAPQSREIAAGMAAQTTRLPDDRKPLPNSTGSPAQDLSSLAKPKPGQTQLASTLDPASGKLLQTLARQEQAQAPAANQSATTLDSARTGATAQQPTAQSNRNPQPNAAQTQVPGGSELSGPGKEAAQVAQSTNQAVRQAANAQAMGQVVNAAMSGEPDAAKQSRNAAANTAQGGAQKAQAQPGQAAGAASSAALSAARQAAVAESLSTPVTNAGAAQDAPGTETATGAARRMTGAGQQNVAQPNTAPLPGQTAAEARAQNAAGGAAATVATNTAQTAAAAAAQAQTGTPQGTAMAGDAARAAQAAGTGATGSQAQAQAAVLAAQSGVAGTAQDGARIAADAAARQAAASGQTAQGAANTSAQAQAGAALAGGRQGTADAVASTTRMAMLDAAGRTQPAPAQTTVRTDAPMQTAFQTPNLATAQQPAVVRSDLMALAMGEPVIQQMVFGEASARGMASAVILNAAMLPGWPYPKPIEGVPISGGARKGQPQMEAPKDVDPETMAAHIAKFAAAKAALQKLLEAMAADPKKRASVLDFLKGLVRTFSEALEVAHHAHEYYRDLTERDDGKRRERLPL